MPKKVVSIDEDQIKEWIEKGVKKLECGNKNHCGSNSGGFIWFLGFIGSSIYFFQGVTTFGSGALALLKAIVWPAYLAFNLLKFLKI